MAKKVSKNSEDIKLLRQMSKSEEKAIKEISEELKGVRKQQEDSHLECLSQL